MSPFSKMEMENMEFIFVEPAKNHNQMEYIIKDGLSVCHRGFVIIEETEHYVNDGFVYCNPNLNCKAWGVTEKKSECEICRQFKPIASVQLSLF